MASLNEISQWEENIYQLETTDEIKGGVDGIANRQAKELANRTRFLKNELDSKTKKLTTQSTTTDNVKIEFNLDNVRFAPNIEDENFYFEKIPNKYSLPFYVYYYKALNEVFISTDTRNWKKAKINMQWDIIRVFSVSYNNEKKYCIFVNINQTDKYETSSKCLYVSDDGIIFHEAKTFDSINKHFIDCFVIVNVRKLEFWYVFLTVSNNSYEIELQMYYDNNSFPSYGTSKLFPLPKDVNSINNLTCCTDISYIQYKKSPTVTYNILMIFNNVIPKGFTISILLENIYIDDCDLITGPDPSTYDFVTNKKILSFICNIHNNLSILLKDISNNLITLKYNSEGYKNVYLGENINGSILYNDDFNNQNDIHIAPENLLFLGTLMAKNDSNTTIQYIYLNKIIITYYNNTVNNMILNTEAINIRRKIEKNIRQISQIEQNVKDDDIGSIAIAYGNKIPIGYLPCNGRTVQNMKELNKLAEYLHNDANIENIILPNIPCNIPSCTYIIKCGGCDIESGA